MKREKRIREHKFVKKQPVLASLLLCATGFFALWLITFIVNMPIQVYASNAYPQDGAIGLLIAVLVVMLVYKRWFAPEFKGFFFRGRPLVGFLLGLVFVAYVVGPRAFVILQRALSGAPGFCFRTPTFAIINEEISAPIREEIAFRGLLLGTLVGEWKHDYKKLILAVMISSVAFGFMHLINLNEGADLLVTLAQVAASIGVGVFFSALFLRSGNLLAPIAYHFLNNFVVALGSSGAANGAAVTLQTAHLINVGLCMVLLVIGLWLLRAKKFDEVEEVLDNMWQTEG